MSDFFLLSCKISHRKPFTLLLTSRDRFSGDTWLELARKSMQASSKKYEAGVQLTPKPPADQNEANGRFCSTCANEIQVINGHCVFVAIESKAAKRLLHEQLLSRTWASRTVDVSVYVREQLVPFFRLEQVGIWERGAAHASDGSCLSCTSIEKSTNVDHSTLTQCLFRLIQASALRWQSGW